MAEDAFLIWLLKLPTGTDVAKAAHAEVARLDARMEGLTDTTDRYRELLLQATRSTSFVPNRHRKRRASNGAPVIH